MRTMVLSVAAFAGLLPAAWAAPKRPARAPAPRSPEGRPIQPEAGLRARARGFIGFNDSFGAAVEAALPLAKGVYEVSARVKTFRDRQAFPGTFTEGTIEGLRRLYHTTIGIRYGVKPPNSEAASYRITQYWTNLTFYGLKLGPEKPNLAYYLWEKGGPPTWIEPYDRNFVTQVTALYTKSDHKIERPPLSRLEITQHVSQFEVRETFYEKHSIAAQIGWNIYSLELNDQDVAVHLDNVRYPGGVFPLRGWPNQFYGAQGWSRVRPGWKVEWGLSRVGLLDKHVETLGSLGLEREWGGFKAHLGFQHRHRLGAETRQGLSGGVSYRF